MKRIGLVTVLLGLCINVFALELDHVQLAQQTQAVSTELRKIIILPNQTLQCAGFLTKASGEVFAGSTFIKYKSMKLAKKAIEKGMQTLLFTDALNCAAKETIYKAQADLLAIDMKL